MLFLSLPHESSYHTHSHTLSQSHPIPSLEGFGVYVYGLANSVQEGVELARKVLYSGKAVETLDLFIKTTQKLCD